MSQPPRVTINLQQPTNQRLQAQGIYTVRIIGVNYYDRHQWIHNEEPMKYTDPLYRPFGEMLQEVFERDRRPLFIAETGTEDDFRPV